MFAKSKRYFMDGDAAQEKAVGGSPGNRKHKGRDAFAAGDEHMRTKAGLADTGSRETRNPRSVWTLSNEPLKAAHFAAYPTELVRRLLIPATSAAGCCPACRTPYAPIVESERIATRPGNDTKVGRASAFDDSPANTHSGDVVGNRDPQRHVAVTRIAGYRASCGCDAGPSTPCIVLDPFLGSGTTAQVSTWYGRDAIGCELNLDYVALAEERIATMPRCMAKQEKKAKKKIKPVATPSLFD